MKVGHGMACNKTDNAVNNNTKGEINITIYFLSLTKNCPTSEDERERRLGASLGKAAWSFSGEGDLLMSETLPLNIFPRS